MISKKAHDSILFGEIAGTNGGSLVQKSAGAGSLVQQTKPKTDSDIFLEKLKSYTVQPNYDINNIKLPDHAQDSFSSELPKTQ
jgi:hypothetical protein